MGDGNQISDYEFRWGDYQPHFTIQANIDSFVKFGHIPWNNMKNIIQVSRKNAISCYHSKKDLEKDKEEGKNLLDEEFSRKFLQDAEKGFKSNWNFFDSIKDIDFSSLTGNELFEFLTKAVDGWSFVIGYFRVSQEEPTYYLFEELKKHFSNDEIITLMISSELDVMNKEQLDWKELSNHEYSKEKLLEHARKYPWTVMCHFTYEDIVDTLTQRYNAHLEFKNIIKEKNELKEKQEKIMAKAPQVKHLVELAQKLAVSRMEIKSCWGGYDFYLIPFFKEVSKRTNESIYELNKYYLLDDIKKLLLESVKLTDEEKIKRDKCLVGLLKNGKSIYVSGDEAEKLAKEELKELYELKEVDEIKGAVANPGKVRGVARIMIANNVEQIRELRKTFEKGHILITEMTQPSIIDIASKAGGLVADEGGMLSHATIISRELKVLCVVGTKLATQVFKDGDMIEVDANKGIVRKIK